MHDLNVLASRNHGAMTTGAAKRPPFTPGIREAWKCAHVACVVIMLDSGTRGLALHLAGREGLERRRPIVPCSYILICTIVHHSMTLVSTRHACRGSSVAGLVEHASGSTLVPLRILCGGSPIGPHPILFVLSCVFVATALGESNPASVSLQ